ncbi:electron transfer flavoprotein [Halorientalis sp. IM1011]|uniref:NAD(P)/FAD-dependent oxidoreductase n=1 Tax=Halorientalis sp. IM1011 TaxID=1932360 RepID=UPI00097CD73D|nr:NAD(P)/FAD-dependent oxidoreductase [Halorientalis sp. IM1011]AQL44138.1 electron transfer flavoprotein [Halorientalis sp. IM1011]
MQQVDVAIVGGGPAGSSAAYEAAVQGADTVVLEKGVPRADREGLGPDSTDAAGMLDYWVDIMDFRPEEIPDDIILSDLEGASFIGPSESVTIRDTGIDATYPDFGFAFHRARFDDWLRERAESAGATYRVGTSVSDVTTDMTGGHSHEIELAEGENVEARYLILADGPQRTVTTDTIDQFLPHNHTVRDYLDSNTANHIAYQEHRRVPEELFDDGLLKFWWGVMPGHTAYPWVFPNDDNVARIGLTMPIGMDLADVANPHDYALLDPDDEQIPPGRVYVRRLLEREYPEYDVDEDFPLVEDRGKRKGTEAYPISSTRPIESPTEAGVAVVGGAMGATSAFHEGGDHVAVRTGKIAGQLAGQGRLDRYNREWKRAIGEEVRRNVALADMVRGWEPDDWDDTFRLVDNMLNRGAYSPSQALGSGLSGIRLVAEYKLRKLSLGSGRYVQLRQDDYLF